VKDHQDAKEEMTLEHRGGEENRSMKRGITTILFGMQSGKGLHKVGVGAFYLLLYAEVCKSEVEKRQEYQLGSMRDRGKSEKKKKGPATTRIKLKVDQSSKLTKTKIHNRKALPGQKHWEEPLKTDKVEKPG